VITRLLLPVICGRLSGRSRIYRRPLIPIVMALAAGIFAGGTWPGYLFQATFAGLLALINTIHAAYCRRPSAWTPLFLLLILGYGAIAPWMPDGRPANHIAHYTDSQRWQIEGTVTQLLAAPYGGARLIMQVTQLTDKHRSFSAIGQLRVTISGDAPVIHPGAHLAFTSRLRSFHNFNNPGGFNYRRFMMFQRIDGSAFVAADRLQVVAAADPRNESLIEHYREQARTLVARLADPDTRAVMRALLIGDQQALAPELRRMFNQSGVGHLLAISGLHIGIVGGLLFALFQCCLNRFHIILDRGWGRRGAALLAIGPVVFYAVLAGMSPATQRAMVMVLAIMATYFVHREGDTLNFLALAAVLILIWHPPTLFSISFQMSFAAVFWIVVGLRANSSGSGTAPRQGVNWQRRVSIFLLITLWATVGTLPLVMASFQEVSLIGLFTNCWMVPLIGLFVLPVGILSLALLPFHAPLAGWILQLAGWGLARGLDGLQALAAFSGIALSTFVPTHLEIVCYYGLLLLVVLRPPIKPARWVLIALVAITVGDGIYWAYQRYWHADLRVTVIDVGQGSSTLVEFPGGETLLVDGGGYTDNRYFDVGQRIVAPFLRYRKIMRVDTVVLSHPNSDHMNGLVYVLAHFEPKELLWTGEGASTASFHRFYTEVVRSGIEVPPFEQIDRRKRKGGVEMSILHPPVYDRRSPSFSPGGRNNDRSIVVCLKMGSCGILMPGDIETSAEEQLIECCTPDLANLVLVAPHHGSRTSSSMRFLKAMHPEIIVISDGWMNRFGFPHPSVLERYHKLTKRIYRTDFHGAVILRTNGDRWRTQSQLN
jgi:competence protein ComEC